ncbi:hypothetical protein RW64_20765 [Geobacter sulfurreducens]|nr:hypothetical protein RW64_20765 [Geobacter sulfurreducens]
MILVPYLLIAIFLFVFVSDAKKGILVAVLIRPVIDCFYESAFALGGIKPTELLGVLLPLLVFFRLLLSKNQGFLRAPLALLWIVYSFFQLFSTVMIFTAGFNFMAAFNHFFRTFNGFIGFFIFQEFFRTREEFRTLLVVHLLAGVFPLGMSVYQNILGGTIRTERTIGGLIRNIGFYHDAYTLRLYCFQTIAAGLLYWAYFLEKSKALRLVLVSMGCVALFTVYKLFSKAGYIVTASWMVVWPLARRKLASFVVVVVIGAAFVVFNSQSKTIDLIYSKEVNALAGEEKTDRMFQGRVGMWKNKYAKWEDLMILNKMLGDGKPNTGAHNDFLRVLFGTGIIGLMLYVTVLSTLLVRLTVRCFRDNTPLNVLALMLILMWLVDALGLVPGAYPGYQVFVWGFVGLALRGISGLKPGEVPDVPAPGKSTTSTA